MDRQTTLAWLSAATALVWLVPVPCVEPAAMSWPEALMGDLLPGQVIEWRDEDEASLIWLRAADTILKHSPQQYDCWIGLDCSADSSRVISLRGARSTVAS